MTITIGSNVSSLRAQRQLGERSDELSGVFERLASGQRINKASDDAAGLGIADSLRTKTRIYNQGVRNINDGISLLSIADGALENLTSIVQRQLELANQAASGGYSDQQRAALQAENAALAQEYDRIVGTTKYNQLSILDGSRPAIGFQTGGNGIRLELLKTTTETAQQTVGTGSYTNYDISVQPPALGNSVSVFVTDINSDGIDDVVSFGADTPGNTFYANVVLGLNNSTSFSRSSSISGTIPNVDPPEPKEIYFAEMVNGNDILVRINDGEGAAANILLTTDADGNFTGHSEVGQIPLIAIDNLGSGDFNNDGVADLVEANSTSVRLRIQGVTTSSTQLPITQSLSRSSTNLSTASNARTAITTLTSDLTNLSSIRSGIGAGMSRLEAAANSTRAKALETSSAESRIRNADMAVDSANLVRNQILQKSGAAVQLQANLQPAIALQLLKI